MTRSLRSLQEWVASLILAPESLAAASQGLDEMFSLPRDAKVAERLRIHADGYSARLEEAMRECFPAVAHVLGARAFCDLIGRYLTARPPRSFNLNHAGRDLADFLRGDILDESLPFLADLAQLEWGVARAFHASSLAVLDPAPLASWTAVDWPSAVLRFQPWVCLVRSAWPVQRVWAARETPIEQIDIDLRAGPTRTLIRRAGFDVECKAIDAAEAAALECLLNGQTLGEVSQTLAALDCDAGEVGRWFGRWIACDMVVACER